jgi:hypothetical protein
MEMPKWSDGNTESVGAYAIALRHQLGYYMKHRVQHPLTAVEHIRHEAPPPAKDPNAERMEYTEETLTTEKGGPTPWTLLKLRDWRQKLTRYRRRCRWIWETVARVGVKRKQSQWTWKRTKYMPRGMAMIWRPVDRTKRVGEDGER